MDFYQNEEVNLIRRVCGWVADIGAALAFAWFFLTFFGGQVEVSGQSMQPLLQGGDVVLMDRLSYEFGNPDRMDVVVFEREDGKENIKRVIGIPGDLVQISDGIVFVNGEAVPDAGMVALAGLAEQPVNLGEDEYFLLGDNRESSEDSRFANMGNIGREQILGKVWLRISPLTDFGLISSRREEENQ